MLEYESKYAYAVARVKVLENRIIDRARLERLVDVDTVDAAVKSLSETDYGWALGEAEGRQDYEAALARELARTYRTILEFAPEPELIGAMLARYDFHNMKALLKARALEVASAQRGIDSQGETSAKTLSVDELIEACGMGLSPLGFVPHRQMAHLVLIGVWGEEGFADSPYGFVPERLLWALQGAREAVLGSSGTAGGFAGLDPRDIDVKCTGAMYGYLLSVAAAFRAEFLTGYLEASVDLTNALSCLRARKLGRGSTFLAPELIPGGRVPEGAFLSAVGGDLEALKEALTDLPYKDLVLAAFAAAESAETLSPIERSFDRFLASMAENTRFAQFGYEPILGYLLRREAEVKALRTLLVCKASGLAPEAIRERLWSSNA